MTMRRLLPALAALLGLACSPAVAGAAGGVDLRVNEGTRWPARELVMSLPHKRVLTTKQVHVLENGTPVIAPKVTSEATNRKRGVILAIDASLTMRGAPIHQAMLAAREFAARRPVSTALGVIFFSGAPRVALAPTTDARQIRATLAVGPQVTLGTKIYDAAAAGITSLKRAGLTSGAIVVLSDGAEAQRGSNTTPAALTQLARGSNVRIFSVGLSSRSFNPSSLRLMADATGGHYGEAARPSDLPPLFAALGDRLSAEYVVSYRSPVRAGTAVQVDTRVNGFPGVSTVDYRAASLPGSGAKPSARPQDSDGLSSGRILVGGVVFFVLVLLGLYYLMRPKKRSLVARVGDFTPEVAASLPSMDSVQRREKRTASDRWQRLGDTIELAGLRISPGGLVLLTATGALLVASYMVLVVERAPLAIVALVVPFGVRAFVQRRVKNRRRLFEEQLPDNLQVLASALRAGYSFSSAMASMAEDAPEPSRSELRRASTDEQLGTDIAEALEAVGQRMANPEIQYVGIVARMQREAGGNTAEVLDQVIETIRGRQELRRRVRVLTAQGRMGGGVISVMPIVLVVTMSLANPGYFNPLFESTIGVLLVFAGLFMLGAGWLIIRKVVDIEP
jgi:tight adherence protein B